MKRRSFVAAILLSFLGTSSLSFFRWLRSSNENKNLARPKFLSSLCDEDTLEMLGQAYLKLSPTSENLLLNDLLAKKSSKISPQKLNISSVELQLEKRITQDFDASDIVVVQGWVLSVTEARQCALFSILNA